MGKVRVPYPIAFRQQMVELVGAGKLPAQLAREFHVSAQNIANLVAKSAIDKRRPLLGM